MHHSTIRRAKAQVRAKDKNNVASTAGGAKPPLQPAVMHQLMQMSHNRRPPGGWGRLAPSAGGVALLRQRPRELLRAAWQELLDASKAWWRGRRGRLADRRRCPISVSLGVVPLVFARFVEVPVRVEVAAGP